MDAQTETGDVSSTAGVGSLARRGGIALGLAVLVNVAIVVAADAAGVAPTLDPLSTGPVVLFTALGVVGATVVYGVLARFRAEPDRLFTGIAAVVLVLSLIPDVTYAPTLPGATTLGVTVLAIMHVTAALVAVAVLTDLVSWP
ncbi:DUF6069 family protein [Halorientalis brevis]|uniref:DUF6069 family protein n=1 Tax=Halorientalis brevis TaxID=1126241 RepID=A0ABD6CF32_9EURY|nr:DUF6069 family protein [Halorientalis brevis]